MTITVYDAHVYYRQWTVKRDVVLLFLLIKDRCERTRGGVSDMYTANLRAICAFLPLSFNILPTNRAILLFFVFFLQERRFKEILFYAFRFKKKLLYGGINCRVFVSSCVLFVVIPRSCVIVAVFCWSFHWRVDLELQEKVIVFKKKLRTIYNF